MVPALPRLPVFTSVIFAFISFAIVSILYLMFDLIKTQFYRCHSTEYAYHNGQFFIFILDLIDNSHKSSKWAFFYLNLSSYFKSCFSVETTTSPLIWARMRSHFFFRQRYRILPPKKRETRGVVLTKRIVSGTASISTSMYPGNSC